MVLLVSVPEIACAKSIWDDLNSRGGIGLDDAGGWRLFAERRKWFAGGWTVKSGSGSHTPAGVAGECAMRDAGTGLQLQETIACLLISCVTKCSPRTE